MQCAVLNSTGKFDLSITIRLLLVYSYVLSAGIIAVDTGHSLSYFNM
jgi:hypothetical protein